MERNPILPQLEPLSANRLDTLRHDFDANKANRMAMNAVTAAGINNVARNYDRARLLQRRFSTVVDNGEATHQDRSGRCWLFSSLNVARFVAKKAMNLKEFEFSQNYAMYFDKLERINYFMQDMAGLVRAGEPVDSRLFQHMLHDVMGDGGQWTMAMNVYKKYGAVPKSLYPETESSKNTSEMNTQLRRLLHTAVAHMQANPDEIDEIIARTVEDGHRMLTIHLGEPPKSFHWEWTDADGVFHRDGEITPVEFWNKYVGGADLESYVCLVDDPRKEHAKGTKIGIEHLGNVAGGDPTEYLNVPIEFMKDCVRDILVEQGIPVWFGADCHPRLDRQDGAWATDLFEYGEVYDVDFDMDKEQRVRFADSAMNHAMAFVGVDVDDDGTTTRRWRVENSWGTKIADKGYFTMADDWFDQYVFEVAVPKAMLPEEYRKALDEAATMLPAWDPMGALASRWPTTGSTSTCSRWQCRRPCCLRSTARRSTRPPRCCRHGTRWVPSPKPIPARGILERRWSSQLGCLTLGIRFRRARGSRRGAQSKRRETMTALRGPDSSQDALLDERAVVPETVDVNIRQLDPIPAPRYFIKELPLTDAMRDLVLDSRSQIRDVLHGRDDRLLAIVGPCSIHDPKAAHEYATRLAALNRRDARPRARFAQPDPRRAPRS